MMMCDAGSAVVGNDWGCIFLGGDVRAGDEAAAAVLALGDSEWCCENAAGNEMAWDEKDGLKIPCEQVSIGKSP